MSAATTIGGAGLTLNASPSSSLGRTTLFYDRRGKFLCAVLRRSGWWAVKNSYGEQWIETNRGRLEAHFTHHLDGWARRSAPGHWNVVAAATDNGPYRFYGRIIQRTLNRWNFSNASGHVLGYTLGPDGPAAGTAALVFWWNDNSRDCSPI